MPCQPLVPRTAARQVFASTGTLAFVDSLIDIAAVEQSVREVLTDYHVHMHVYNRVHVLEL